MLQSSSLEMQLITDFID